MILIKDCNTTYKIFFPVSAEYCWMPKLADLTQLPGIRYTSPPGNRGIFKKLQFDTNDMFLKIT